MENSLLNDLLLIDEPLVEDFDASDHDEELITDYDLVEPNLPDLYCTTSGHVSHFFQAFRFIVKLFRGSQSVFALNSNNRLENLNNF
jgi:hypothetical protein